MMPVTLGCMNGSISRGLTVLTVLASLMEMLVLAAAPAYADGAEPPASEQNSKPLEATYDDTQPGADDPRVKEGFAAYQAGDFKKAYAIWLPLAEAGNAEAQFRIGRLFDRGEGVVMSGKSAIYWYNDAADKGHTTAAYNAAILCENGAKDLQPDIMKAIKYFKLASKNGDPIAAFNIGVIYGSGEKVPENDTIAFENYKIAASKCYIDAQINLGILYARTKTNAQNYAEAHKWLLIAAMNGSLDALETNEVLKKFSSETDLKEGKRRMQVWIKDHTCIQ